MYILFRFGIVDDRFLGDIAGTVIHICAHQACLVGALPDYQADACQASILAPGVQNRLMENTII